MRVKLKTFWDAWTYRLQSILDCIRFARALGWRGVIHIHILWSSLDGEERTRFVRAAGPALNDAWNRVRALNDDHPLVQLERGEITADKALKQMNCSSYTQLMFLAGTYGVQLSLADLDLNSKVVDEIPIPIYVRVDQASDFDSALAIAQVALFAWYQPRVLEVRLKSAADRFSDADTWRVRQQRALRIAEGFDELGETELARAWRAVAERAGSERGYHDRNHNC